MNKAVGLLSLTAVAPGAIFLFTRAKAEGAKPPIPEPPEDIPEEPSKVPWRYSEVQCSIEPSIGIWHHVVFSARISNVGDSTVTKRVALYWRRLLPEGWGGWFLAKEVDLTLESSHSLIFTSDPDTILLYYGYTLELMLVDSDGDESPKCRAVL